MLFRSQNTSGNVYNTGIVTFTQPTYFTNTAAATSNTTGGIVVTGGVGVTGNVYTGSIIVTGSTSNGITFADGTTQYTANVPDSWARTQANAAYNQANNATDSWVRTQANNAYDKANSAGSFANGAFTTANSGASFANGAFDRANAAYAQANTDTTNISITAGTYGNSSIIPVITVAANGRITAVSNVASSGGGGGGSGITYTAANTAPSSPSLGDKWYYVANDILYEYINDGFASYWVDIVTPTVPLGGTAAGSNTQLQYNNNGLLGGISTITWNGSQLSLGANSNISITGGINGQVLSTNGSGGLSWQTPSSGISNTSIRAQAMTMGIIFGG